MKKISIMSLLLVFFVSIVFGGGIVTNTNQSAAYVRTLNRNASTYLDAVYFNPAGLTEIEDGFYIGLSNQSIWQTKKVVNDYKGTIPQVGIPYGLNEDTYTGDVKALIFPDLYLAYKMGKFALSAAVMPIGGGGSADFAKGLPSFEMPVSDLVPGLAAQGVTEYDMDAAFEGSSIYLGTQAGVAYKINDMLSVSVGGRYVSALNSYKGHLKNIAINMGGTWIPASTFFTGAATSASNAALGLQPLVDGGAGGYTLAQAQGAGYLTAAQVAELEGGLQQSGIDPSGYTINDVQNSYNGISSAMTNRATEVGDKEVDVTQTGSGFSPIIGLNITPVEGLNIGFRYEFITKLELENETKEGKDAGMDEFKDGVKSHADMPAMLGLGIAYKVTPQLRAEADFCYYMNKGVDWDGREENVENDYEAGVAFEYAVNEKLKASFGYSYSKSGALEDYQSDISYSLSANTIALGVAYTLSPKINIDFGFLNAFYQEGQKSFEYLLSDMPIPVTEKYNKTATGFAIGINYSF